jgi:hypothetical protein
MNHCDFQTYYGPLWSIFGINQPACKYLSRLVEFVSFNLYFLCWWFILRNLQNNSYIVISAQHRLWGDLHIASLHSSSYNSLCALSLLSLMGTSNADRSRTRWLLGPLMCIHLSITQLRMETDRIRMESDPNITFYCILVLSNAWPSNRWRSNQPLLEQCVCVRARARLRVRLCLEHL